jgi:hypothetical protein
MQVDVVAEGLEVEEMIRFIYLEPNRSLDKRVHWPRRIVFSP